jgi:hypothetical protein
LKTLEKINRKEIRNSLEIEKAISAHLAQAGPAPRARLRTCPPPVSDGWAPPVGARLSAPSLPLSLATPWVGPVGAGSLVCAHSPSLCPTVPTSQSSSTFHPRSPHRGRVHDRAFSDHVRAPAPLLSPAPCSPTSPLSFTPSAQLSRPLSRSTHTSRELHHRPPTTTACSVATITPVPRPAPR